MIDPVFVLLISLGAGGIFVAGSWAKWQEREMFAAALENYELIPSVTVPSASRALITAEFAIGLLMLIPVFRPWPQLAGVALLALVTVAVVINLLRGREHISCGCGGASGEQTLSWTLALRNALLAGLLLAASLLPAARPLNWLDYSVALIGALMLAGVYATGSQLLANHPRLTALRDGL